LRITLRNLSRLGATVRSSISGSRITISSYWCVIDPPPLVSAAAVGLRQEGSDVSPGGKPRGQPVDHRSGARCPPAPQSGLGLIRPERTLVEARFEKVPVGLPDDRARCDSEDSHDRLPVEIGPHRVEFFFGGERR